MRPPAEAEAPAAFLYDTDWSARPPQNPRSSTRLFFFLPPRIILERLFLRTIPISTVLPRRSGRNCSCGNRYSQSNPLCAHTPGISLGKLEQITRFFNGPGNVIRNRRSVLGCRCSTGSSFVKPSPSCHA